MPPKKKIAMTKSSGKSTRQPAPVKDIQEGRDKRRGTEAMREPVESAAVVAARAQAQAQLKSFEQGIKLLHAGKFNEAKPLFVQAASGPNREMAHNADLHVRMCDRRLEKPALEFRTVEDRYNYAIAMINARNLAAATEQLQAALRLDPRADHVHYGLALCRGLSGDLAGAYENLKRAIELNPRNRLAARQDADFSGISNQSPLRELLYPEKSGPSQV
jgi:tetratricopeptide (TPR) repeat protein